MKIVNIHEAKTHLSKLVEEVLGGETVIVAKAGKPMVQLAKIGAPRGVRPLGLLAGKGKEMPGCWDADPELEETFYGSEESVRSPKVAE
ncbi:MAG: type II toxin-antitoxin system prevent-host-death family antitoxin [Chthoniobacterales bacterium]|nr:type II toxin-antitoxin system prevent-host-death family antitoxin [Chthoniobacterales bacterium]